MLNVIKVLCYAICNRNTTNMEVVALYLWERLDNILYAKEINFLRILLVFGLLLSFFYRTSSTK